VQYDEFITSVREREVPREQAETLTHARLRVLAERLTGGEADDLRAEPPGELQADLIPPTPEAGESRPAVAMSSTVSSTKSRYLFRSSLSTSTSTSTSPAARRNLLIPGIPFTLAPRVGRSPRVRHRVVAGYSCTSRTSRTAMAPSPTADATRLSVGPPRRAERDAARLDSGASSAPPPVRSSSSGRTATTRTPIVRKSP
jgi:uncharacterized protein (DUF2267 family)